MKVRKSDRIMPLYSIQRLITSVFILIMVAFPSFLEQVEGNELSGDEGHQVIYAEAVLMQSTLYWKWQKEYDSALDRVVKYNAEADRIQRKEKCIDGNSNTEKSKRTILKNHVLDSMKTYYQNWLDQRKVKEDTQQDQKNDNNVPEGLKPKFDENKEVLNDDNNLKETRFLRNSNPI